MSTTQDKKNISASWVVETRTMDIQEKLQQFVIWICMHFFFLDLPPYCHNITTMYDCLSHVHPTKVSASGAHKSSTKIRDQSVAKLHATSVGFHRYNSDYWECVHSLIAATQIRVIIFIIVIMVQNSQWTK